MILLLGGTGYVGAAFVKELNHRNWPYVNLSRAQTDYTRFSCLLRILRELNPQFLINCAGYTGKPNVDACEQHRAETLLGNASLPATIGHACQVAGVPWGHVSSGCIFAGAKILHSNEVRVERDLTAPGVKELIEKDPSIVHGFSEGDRPNFSFRSPPCSFYSGSKALGEEALEECEQVYVWRLRIPFDENDGPRNYLSKIQRYSKVYQNINSISHLGDYVRACLDLWQRRAPFGTYNVTNPGWVDTRQVVQILQRHLPIHREFEFWQNDDEFYKVAALTPRSNCVMNVQKLLNTGVTMRPVIEALEDALNRWTPQIPKVGVNLTIEANQVCHPS